MCEWELPVAYGGIGDIYNPPNSSSLSPAHYIQVRGVLDEAQRAVGDDLHEVYRHGLSDGVFDASRYVMKCQGV